MPSSVRRSGWVRVEFDVRPNGRPENIELVDSSEELFVKPALESVERWLFPPGMPEADRKGLRNQITFQLNSERGEIIPPAKPVLRRSALG